MSYLDSIIERKKLEVAAARNTAPLVDLKESLLSERKTISLAEKIKKEDEASIIAEFKRASPSRGVFSFDVSVEEVTKGYEEAGAAAISVLTDEKGFSGTLEDLQTARASVSLPVLRKDFIVDSYQLYEARAYGADLVLLIAAALDVHQSEELAAEARSLGLEVLLELHSTEELPYINDSVSIVGVNNRDLKTFSTSLEVSMNMVSSLPKDKPIISESGIANIHDVLRLQKAGFDGFLIGGSFMEEERPASVCKAFISNLRQSVAEEQ